MNQSEGNCLIVVMTNIAKLSKSPNSTLLLTVTLKEISLLLYREHQPISPLYPSFHLILSYMVLRSINYSSQCSD